MTSCKKVVSNLYKATVLIIATAYYAGVQAAPLNLVTTWPDLDSNGMTMNYIYTPAVGMTPGFGELTMTGNSADASKNGTFASGVLAGEDYKGVSSQSLTFDNGTPAILISAAPAGNNVNGTTGNTRSPYLLKAFFDENGVFQNGQVRVDGYGVDVSGFVGTSTANPFFNGTNSGTILTADLTSFGFQGTPTQAGNSDTIVFEWTTDVTGGDLFDLGLLVLVVKQPPGTLLTVLAAAHMAASGILIF